MLPNYARGSFCAASQVASAPRVLGALTQPGSRSTHCQGTLRRLMAQLSSLVRRGRGPFILLSAISLAALFWGETFRSRAAMEPIPAASGTSSLASAHNLE